MNKQVVARLEVILTDQGSEYSPAERSMDGVHRIYVDMNDVNKLHQMGLISHLVTQKKEVFTNIVAHELGHFVAQITGQYDHNMKRPSATNILFSENLAWTNAEKIAPITHELKRGALGSYEKRLKFLKEMGL